MKPYRINNCTVFASILILAGLVFRLIFIGQSHFAFDEAFFYDTALKVAGFKLFPVYGAYVTGASTRVPGGGFHLLMALPLLFSRHPYGPLILVILLGSVGQVLIFRLFLRHFGCKGALFGLLLTVFNPFFVFFSDSIWNPDVLIFFGATYFLLISSMDEQGKARAFALGFLLSFLPQIHLSTVHLTLLTLGFMAVKRPKWRYKALFAGAAMGLLTYIPYFWVDFHHHFANTRALLHPHTKGFQPLETLRALAYLFIYPAGEATYFIAKGSWYPLQEWRFYPAGIRTYLYDVSHGHTWGYVVVAILIAAVLLSVVAAIRWLFRKQDKEDPLFTLYWLNLLILPVEFFLARKAFYPHYTIVLFPLTLAPLSAMAMDINPKIFKGLLTFGLFLALAQGITSRGWYQQEERFIGLATFLPAGKHVCFDRSNRLSFRIAAARTRVGDYPMRTLCRDFYRHQKTFTGRAKTLYTVFPKRDNRPWKPGKNLWDLGTAWLKLSKTSP